MCNLWKHLSCRGCSSFPLGAAVPEAGPAHPRVPVGTEKEQQAGCQAARLFPGCLEMFSKAAGSGCPDALQQTEQQELTYPRRAFLVLLMLSVIQSAASSVPRIECVRLQLCPVEGGAAQTSWRKHKRPKMCRWTLPLAAPGLTGHLDPHTPLPLPTTCVVYNVQSKHHKLHKLMKKLFCRVAALQTCWLWFGLSEFGNSMGLGVYLKPRQPLGHCVCKGTKVCSFVTQW